MPFEHPSETQFESHVVWNQIEISLTTLTSTVGGYSDARRGIVTLPDGKRVFVKIGTNELTKKWAAKEVEVYAFLEASGFPHCSRLLSANADKTSFALESLLPEDGWDWSDAWSRERLDATLGAMDALAALKPDPKYRELFKPVISEDDNGWPKLLASLEQQTALASKMPPAERSLLEDLVAQAQQASQFTFRRDALIHVDVRADNCAWNSARGEVRLVDWNWIELGDRRVDLAAFLVHVHQAGLDVTQECPERLDADALQWIAGFWLEAASKPIWPGGPEKLRDMQLNSGLTALKLSKEIGA